MTLELVKVAALCRSFTLKHLRPSSAIKTATTPTEFIYPQKDKGVFVSSRRDEASAVVQPEADVNS